MMGIVFMIRVSATAVVYAEGDDPSEWALEYVEEVNRTQTF